MAVSLRAGAACSLAPQVGMVRGYPWEGVSVFGWLKRQSQPSATGELIATQPHGEIFPWPKGAVLTAIDELVLALPVALFEDRPMGDSLFAPAEAEINIPPGGDTFFVRLMPGMSIRLAKSVQSYVVSADGKPRRIKVQSPAERSPGAAALR